VGGIGTIPSKHDDGEGGLKRRWKIAVVFVLAAVAVVVVVVVDDVQRYNCSFYVYYL